MPFVSLALLAKVLDNEISKLRVVGECFTFRKGHKASSPFKYALAISAWNLRMVVSECMVGLVKFFMSPASFDSFLKAY
jgi:hypothetical protein